jgi:glutamate racemase
MKIGVFDSGIGGMTVLKELIQTFPKAQYVYMGDTANVPYGTKSSEKIRELCREATGTLKNRDIDIMVIACNTASSLALNIFKNELAPIPVYGVVVPGVEALVHSFNELEYSQYRRVLILGTKATVNSRIYSREVRKHIIFNEISEQACPLAVPIIEEGWVGHPILLETLNEYVKQYKEDKIPGIALLACTHYPWAQPIFEKALPGWTIVNSAKAVARYIKDQNLTFQNEKSGLEVEWIFTDPKAVTEVALNDFKESLGIVIQL